MTKMKCILLVVGFCFQTGAWAAGHLESLSGGGGIAITDPAQALEQNAGALVSWGPPLLDLHASTNVNGDPQVGGTFLINGYLGKFAWGGAVGIANPHLGNRRGVYGLGFRIPWMRTSIGVSGSTAVSSPHESSVNAGIQIDPSRDYRIGFAARGLTGGPDSYGAGLGAAIGERGWLAFDFGADNELKNISALPAVVFGNPTGSLSFGYSLALAGRGNWNHFKDGLTVGLAMRLGTVNWSLYYGHPSGADFYTGFTFDL